MTLRIVGGGLPPANFASAEAAGREALSRLSGRNRLVGEQVQTMIAGRWEPGGTLLDLLAMLVTGEDCEGIRLILIDERCRRRGRVRFRPRRPLLV